MKTCAFTLSLVIAIPSLLQAQTSAAPAQRSDLAEISETLKRIEVALKHQADIQKADLLLRRVMFAATQIATAETSLKRIEEESRSVRGESSDIESAIKRLEQSPESEERQAQMLAGRNRITNLQDRLTALEQERVSIQNEIQGLRRDNREWQALLDKTLVTP